jgi:Immunity protein 35
MSNVSRLMFTKEQARQSVVAHVCERPEWLPPEDELVIVDESTIERPWGWVFFHAPNKWLETQDLRYALAGNAPTLVERESGKIFSTGTAMPIEHYIASYERTGNPHG